MKGPKTCSQKSVLADLMLVAGLVQGVAAGQSGNGYLSVGGGSRTGADLANSSEAFTQVDAGGEFVAAQTIGFGGEFGIVKKHSSFGFVSLDASFHLLRNASSAQGTTGKVDPFVTGGYTRASDILSGANGANFGVGLNYWLTRHFGVRAEFRDIVFSSGTPTENFWAIRGGVAFR
jgi:hypothetical protein